MKRSVYRPKIVEGKIGGTGWPIDGHILTLSLWDYDNYESWHLSGWPNEAGKAVMETMFITETAAGMCLYDTLEEFADHWDEWEAQGIFCIPKENVEVIRIQQVETKEVRSFQDLNTGGLKQPIICVYSSPQDYPDKFVARIFDGTKPTNVAIIKETIEEIREDIIENFPDKIPFARCKEDCKSIVESWI